MFSTFVLHTNPANPGEPVIPHAISERPYSKLGLDIFTFKGRLSFSRGLLFQISKGLPVTNEDCKLRFLTPEDLLCEAWHT